MAPCRGLGPNLTSRVLGVHPQRDLTIGMIILVADDNAPGREPIQRAAGRIRPGGQKLDSGRSFGIAPHSLTYSLNALQRWNNQDVAQMPMVYSTPGTLPSMAPSADGRVTRLRGTEAAARHCLDRGPSRDGRSDTGLV